MALAAASGGEAPGLVLDGVSVSYAGRAILSGLNLEISGGGVTAFLGPSGVGKSTLLRRLAGLLEGEGRVVASDGFGLDGRVAFMGQSDLLMPWLTVAGNAALGARLRGEDVDRARLAGVISAVGLTGHEGKRPDKLSGGMRQRTALARTLMEDRPVVLMDEPFSAVDALTRLKLQDLAARLLADRTVLLVTHDPWEAIRIADRIIVLAGDPAGIAFDVSPESDAPRSPNLEEARDLWRRAMAALGGEQAA